MKRIICLLITLSLITTLSATVIWHTSDEITFLKESTGITDYISAWASCDTKAEVEKITRIVDLDYFFDSYTTIDNEFVHDYESYEVMFVTINYTNCIYVFHYSVNSPVVEIFYIVR